MNSAKIPYSKNNEPYLSITIKDTPTELLQYNVTVRCGCHPKSCGRIRLQFIFTFKGKEPIVINVRYSTLIKCYDWHSLNLIGEYESNMKERIFADFRRFVDRNRKSIIKFVADATNERCKL